MLGANPHPHQTTISLTPGAVEWSLMVDRFESGTVLGGLGYGGKPLYKNNF